MNRLQAQYWNRTFDLGLPINKKGYAEVELLFIDQLICEYAAHCIDIFYEIECGNLPAFVRNNKILIARSDAELWSEKHLPKLLNNSLDDHFPRKPRFSKPRNVR